MLRRLLVLTLGRVLLPVLLGRGLLVSRVSLGRRLMLSLRRIAAVLRCLRGAARRRVLPLRRLTVVALALRRRRLLILALAGGRLRRRVILALALLAIGWLAVALVGHVRSCGPMWVVVGPGIEVGRRGCCRSAPRVLCRVVSRYSSFLEGTEESC